MQQIAVSPSGRVYLTLPGKAYKSRRHIGDIVGDTLHVHRNPDNQFFRQFNGSIGFNYELMRDGSFNLVVVHLPFSETLETTRRRILRKGRMLNFQRNKLERQIFLSLEDFQGDDAVESKEGIERVKSNSPVEPTLFSKEVLQ